MALVSLQAYGSSLYQTDIQDTFRGASPMPSSMPGPVEGITARKLRGVDEADEG